MLRIYRRHLKTCAHYGKPRNTPRIKCVCPIWVQGTLGRETVRKSLDLTSWQAASDLVKSWEASGELGVEKGDIPNLREAVKLFVESAIQRNLSPASIVKIRRVLEGQLLPWCSTKGYARLRTLDPVKLQEFRSSWNVSAITASKKLEVLKSFFRFCVDSGWILLSPAKVLKPPKITDPPTLPFTDDEFRKICVGARAYPIKGRADVGFRDRLYALVLLLRFSGLRISDAVFVTKDRFHGNVLKLRTAKTGAEVCIPLPPQVIEALIKIDYRFFGEESLAKPKHIVGSYQRSFFKMSEWCGVSNIHAHRFRDTFSVSLLEAGVSIELVATLLGHSNIRITQKHYNPWIKERQAGLTAAVMKTWDLTS